MDNRSLHNFYRYELSIEGKESERKHIEALNAWHNRLYAQNRLCGLLNWLLAKRLMKLWHLINRIIWWESGI